MTTGKYQALIAASFTWIEAHPDAVNTEIPNGLLTDWLHLFESSDDEAEDARITIFTFGFKVRIAHEFKCSAKQEVKVSYEKLWEYFKRWHFRLLMAKWEAARPEGMAAQSMRLFDFEPPELDYGGFRNPSSN
ncbi:MAG TPA: hypothetical protein VK985_13465 [Rariglobus sp.]|nr:hypothetical protein [Rariglobus sp.]